MHLLSYPQYSLYNEILTLPLTLDAKNIKYTNYTIEIRYYNYLMIILFTVFVQKSLWGNISDMMDS